MDVIYKKLWLILLFLLISPTIFAQGIIWQEDFSTYPNGTTAGSDINLPAGNDWIIDHNGGGTFSVQGAEFQCSGMSAEAVWTSETIDISSSNYVRLSIEATWIMTSFFNNSDYIRMYYLLDGGSEELFFEEESGFFTAGGSATASRVLSGTSLQIVIRVNTDDFIYFDNAAVTTVPILYSRNNGAWSNGNTWSADDFSTVQVSCGCTPTDSEVVIIGNGNQVVVNTDASAAAVVIQNSGILRWTGNASLNIASGLVEVQSGGTISNNGNVANMHFNNPLSARLHNSGSYSITNLVLPEEGSQLEITGDAAINVLNDIDFEQDNIVLTNNLTAGLFANRVLFDNDNSSIINNGVISLSGNIEAGAGDDGNVLTNSAGATVTFNGISLNNSNLTINNSGVINQTGSFTNGTIDTGSRFNNLNGATWNWSHVGAAYDASVNSVLDCSDGVNTFNYNGTGAQNIIPVDYSNLTISGSAVKFAQGELDVNGNLFITGSAQLDPGANNMRLAGNWVNDSGNVNPFDEGNSTVIFDGGVSQTITSAGEETFNGMAVLKSGGSILLSSDVRISGTLTLNSGNVDVGNSNLTITSAGRISGGTIASFIIVNNGTLIQSNIGVGGRTGAILFPVGVSSSSYTPLTFDNSTGVADDFSVNLCDRINLGGDCGLAGIDGDAVGRMWFIEEGIIGGSDATITLQWTASEELPGFDRTEVNLLHHNDAAWEIMYNGPSAGSGPFTATASGITSFSPFGIESAESAPLPVDLLYFSAQLAGEQVNLVWETASELNNDFFTIEKTTDLQNFKEVATVKGKGNSEMKSRYFAVDPNPSFGDSYYRLKQTDYDGTSKGFNLIKVVYDATQDHEEIYLYPVPGNGEYLNIRFGPRWHQDVSSVRVYDVQGNVVHEQSITSKDTGQARLQFNRRLSAGIYTLQIDAAIPFTNTFIVR